MAQYNKCLILLGSNEDKEKNIALASELLRNIFDKIVFSETRSFPSREKKNIPSYLNRIAAGMTSLEKEEVISCLKDIEHRMGRLPEHKKAGKIIIDLDLLKWNSEVLKEEEMQQEYVIACLQAFPSVL